VKGLDRIDRQLLNILQADFPLVPEPFAAIARRLGVATEEVMARTRRLKDEGIIRQISAIFDSRRLDYQSTLVAMQVSPERLDEVAAIVGAHPGVSHNYGRDLTCSLQREAQGCQRVRHYYNLWFTLTLPLEEEMEETIVRLAEEAKVEKYLILPAERVFKIGVTLDMLGDDEARPQATKEAPSAPWRSSPRSRPLSEKDKAVIRELQEDLDIVPRPFDDMAQRLRMSVEEFLTKAQEFQRTGVMRRFGAVLRHHRVGFRANGMGCWVVSLERIEEVGSIAASFSAVSHCYQRPAYPPDWPYNLFTMIHGKNKEEVEGVAAAIAERTGIEDYVILYSTKEYKKERVKYFV
jgi:DNA-binding Lrp family transcriptional regulator